MILQTLNDYYQRLETDPDVDVAPFGYSVQRISFCITINADGTFDEIKHLVEDIRLEQGGKLYSRPLVVFGNSKPPGSGINPCFLWDNPAYILGYKSEDAKPERTNKCFEAFRQRHLDLEQEINVPEFSAVCRFLKNWNPEQAEKSEVLVELGTGFGVFRIRGEQQYVHEIPALQEWWNAQLHPAESSSKEIEGECLITGENSALARLHEPKIKGVSGGQSSGASIVSFNATAFESYGKAQSFNAPVSEKAAFQYCTALNRLLADRSRRIQIGDATTVFWTEQKTEAEEIFGLLFGNQLPAEEAEDGALAVKLNKTLNAISRGKYPGEFGDPETPFYLLGLSPNAARISVRFWLQSNLRELVDNLHDHYEDLRMVHGPKEDPFISPWRMVRETVRDSRDIPPLLGGAVMRAILMGQPYPMMLLSGLIRRIRADRKINYVRAAVIKACLNRNSRNEINPLSKELSMSLDPDRDDPAYCLGRLFAELEKTQVDALPGIGDTIKDRFFGAASATPGSVFPRLIRMSQHHLGKLEKGSRTYHEKRIQEICTKLNNFPGHLNLKDQGLFAIGYYHQRQEMFTKKTKSTTPVETEE